MKITEDHWLEEAIRRPIDGGSGMPTRRFLVIHFTSGWTAESSIAFWRSPDAKGANAHIIIDRDGTIYQCRPFNRTAGHAGASSWKDPKTGVEYTGLNGCAIGIELANTGDMTRTPDVYPKTMGELAGSQVPRKIARHKNGGRETGWEIYSPTQLASCEKVALALVQRYNLDDVVGHEDIAPKRKVDPGPAFPMKQLRASCGFTKPLPSAV